MDDLIVKFKKYQGAGNDFVVINDMNKALDGIIENPRNVRKICHRSTGVGADGMVVIRPHFNYDYEVLYYCQGGPLGMLCGNASRCAVRFMYESGIVKKKKHSFTAYDGAHVGKVLDDTEDSKSKLFQISLADVDKVNTISTDEYFLNTGCLHYVIFVDSLDIDISTIALRINDMDTYKHNACVMFAMKTPNERGEHEARAYERGVCGETQACGTGAVAISMALAVRSKIDTTKQVEYKIKFPGGVLQINYDYTPPSSFTNVWLAGPACKVFDGTYKLIMP